MQSSVLCSQMRIKSKNIFYGCFNRHILVQNFDCIANMKALIAKYNTPVMMCEIGISWDYEEAEAFYTDFVTKAKQVDQCLGVFTWEPQCYGNWKGYSKGMFDDSGKPTNSFNAFKR